MLNEAEMPVEATPVSEEPVLSLEQYKRGVADRLGDLDLEEAKGLAKLHGTPELITLSKVIGPEISQVMAEGLNMIAQSVAQQEQAPMVAPPGLGG